MGITGIKKKSVAKINPNQVRIKDYKPDKNNQVDLLVQKAMMDYLDSPLTLERCSTKGWYIFGTQKVFIELKEGKLTSQVGGGYTFFADYLISLHQKLPQKG